MHGALRGLVAGFVLGSFAHAPGRGRANDALTVHVSSATAGAVVWSEHAPETGGDMRQLGFTASAAGPGPTVATASYVVTADEVQVCAVTVPCDVAAEYHLHSDCSSTPVPASSHVALVASVSGCTGGAFPPGHLTPRFQW